MREKWREEWRRRNEQRDGKNGWGGNNEGGGVMIGGKERMEGRMEGEE